MHGIALAALLFQVGYTGFEHPEPVTIANYSGEAMEPFVTHDGRFLLFNNRNDPGMDTNLHYAERVDDAHFIYRGEIQGVNTTSLEAVASVSCGGELYFVSTRSYAQTFSTLYRARWANGAATAVEVVPGISRKTPGWVNFDAEVSANGRMLYAVDARFSADGRPLTANLFIAQMRSGAFERLPNSDELLGAVNGKGLQYAPAVSADGLELFFTRVAEIREDAEPHLWRSVRRSASDPFEAPQRVAAITGFTEAATLSADGLSLYYHERVKGRFAIFRVKRGARTAGVHSNGCAGATQ